MLASFRSISLLSVVSLLISTFFIAYVLEFASQFVGFPIPFSVTLIFGALISATDPVAVLALFKEYGAPKRLSLIFEGESLFNDGTSLALFLVVLELLVHQYSGDVASAGIMTDIVNGSFMFATMVVGGVIFGGLMGALFSKIIQQVRDNEFIEITLTMIVAHFTFILSEMISASLVIGGHSIHLSAIIATVVAAMVVGNYGRYKISPVVAEYMEHFWGYFAFVANSIIFILIGLLFASLPIKLTDILPITFLAILIVMVGRALSVYPVVGLLNLAKKEAHIPARWQHLLAWGSLRGALAVTMVLLIPDSFAIPNWPYDFTVKEFITALTIACIYFTLFVKGMTIGPMIKVFRLNALNDVETAEYHEAKSLLFAKLLLEVDRFFRKGYINEQICNDLKHKYEGLYLESSNEGGKVFSGESDLTERVLIIYALSIAKHSLNTLFKYNEVSETVYKKILVDLAVQLEHAEETKMAVIIDLADFKRDWLDILHDIWEELHEKDPHRNVKTLYMFYRAHTIIMRKAIEEIECLSESNLNIFRNSSFFDNILAQLTLLEEGARKNVALLTRDHEVVIAPLALRFAEAGLFKAERKLIETFGDQEVITPKVRALLVEELESARKTI
jgi:CPA1 family monovalent cation:H+ antiporter